MPTTTNNGWTTPADTALVKDGASAIRTLGNNIDSTLGVYASPGLVKINTTTFSGVSTQQINSLFTTTYDNYLLQFTFLATSSANFNLRISTGGTPVATGYTQYNTLLTSAGSYSNFSSGTGKTELTPTSASTSNAVLNLHIFDPFKTDVTSFVWSGISSEYDRAAQGAGRLATSTSYDGIYFLGGTFTGSVKTYGYNK